jgi:hypothetical protein
MAESVRPTDRMGRGQFSTEALAEPLQADALEEVRQ